MNMKMRKALFDDLYLDVIDYLDGEGLEIKIDNQIFTSMSETGKKIRATLKEYLYSMADEEADYWVSRIETIENISVED